MIVSVPDELIMALADGELEAPVATRLRWLVRTDAAVRRKHEVFQATRQVLSHTFDGIAAEPVPERLREAVARLKARTR